MKNIKTFEINVFNSSSEVSIQTGFDVAKKIGAENLRIELFAKHQTLAPKRYHQVLL
jgi:hypothetical protein